VLEISFMGDVSLPDLLRIEDKISALGVFSEFEFSLYKNTRSKLILRSIELFGVTRQTRIYRAL